VHVDGMRKLLTYLTEDCCQGQPELCGTAVRKARALCTTGAGRTPVRKVSTEKTR